MRKQLIKLAASALTLPIAACSPTKQEMAAVSCMKKEVPALHDSNGNPRDIDVQIANSGNSVVLTSGSANVGPLESETRRIATRAYDGFRDNPAGLKITVVFVNSPTDKKSSEKLPGRIDIAPLSRVPGAAQESAIVRNCLETTEVLKRPAPSQQMASLLPR